MCASFIGTWGSINLKMILDLFYYIQFFQDKKKLLYKIYFAANYEYIYITKIIKLLTCYLN